MGQSENPYRPLPVTDVEEAEAGERNGNALRSVLLCIVPWRLTSIAGRVRFRESVLLGWIGLSAQFGLTLLCVGISLGEPYGSVEEVIDIPVRSYVFCLLLGALPAALAIGFIIAIFGKRFGKCILLSAWVTLIPFLLWLFCFFQFVLGQPGFTLATDHRPAWMTHDVVTTLGNPLCWIIFFVAVTALLTALTSSADTAEWDEP